jgi:uncharacterized membrane protein
MRMKLSLSTMARLTPPGFHFRYDAESWRKMMLDAFRGISLVAATITMGLVTGAFALYAHTIMPGLKATDDRTFVTAFQSMDRAIINPWFMVGGFVGALVFTGVAAALHLGPEARSVLPWVAVAFVLYLVAFVITIAVNVPLNDGLKAAGNPSHITDLAAVRHRFNEARWVTWNNVRTAVSLVAFGCLSWALVLYGRTRGA